jgi:hypothetical protein
MTFSRVKFAFRRHTPDTPSLKYTIVNLSDKPLDDALHLHLWKGLNYAVALTLLPFQDILNGAKTAVKPLPVEMVEEAREENMKILKGSSVPKENLTGADRTSLRAKKTKLNSVALVRERTIPTERPPPVGEVSANFCG